MKRMSNIGRKTTGLPAPPIVNTNQCHNYSLRWKACVLCYIKTISIPNPTTERQNRLCVSAYYPIRQLLNNKK